MLDRARRQLVVSFRNGTPSGAVVRVSSLAQAAAGFG